MPIPFYKIATITALLLVVGSAVWRGERYERWAAAAAVLAALATPLAQDRLHWLEPQYGILAVDIGLLAALIWIALKNDRYWPLWAAGLQLLGVFIHVARIVDPIVLPHAYYRGLSIYSYLVMTAMVVGSLMTPRRPHKRE